MALKQVLDQDRSRWALAGDIPDEIATRMIHQCLVDFDLRFPLFVRGSFSKVIQSLYIEGNVSCLQVAWRGTTTNREVAIHVNMEANAKRQGHAPSLTNNIYLE